MMIAVKSCVIVKYERQQN